MALPPLLVRDVVRLPTSGDLCYTDIIGMVVRTEDGIRLGTVIYVHCLDGPYCEITVSIDHDKVDHPAVTAQFFSGQSITFQEV